VLDAAYDNTPDPQRRAFIDVDRTLFSDDWRKMGVRIERSIEEPGCARGIWLELARSYGFDTTDVYRRAVECDPLDYSIWSSLIASQLWMGDAEGALASVARGEEKLGTQAWLLTGRVNAFMMLGRFDEARRAAARMPDDIEFFDDLPIRVEAAAGNLDEAKRLADERPPGVFRISQRAILGDREGANALAAEADAQPGGPSKLMVMVQGCYCGAAWDIEATPNFKRMFEQTGFDWPPKTLIHYPAKDW
jgi:adenylate cyclase